MPTALTEDASAADFGTGLPVPANGDNGSVWCPQVIAGLQQLADRTQKIADNVPSVLSGNEIRSVSFKQALYDANDRFGGASTVPAPVLSSEHFYFLQFSVTDAGILWFDIDPLPVGRELVNVYMEVDGDNFGAASHGALPATMPTLSVHYQDAGVDAQLATATDSSASVSAYHAVHNVTATPGATHTIAAGRKYTARITGEASTNSVAQAFTVLGLFVTLGPAP